MGRRGIDAKQGRGCVPRLLALALNLAVVGGLLWWWHPAFVFDRLDDAPWSHSPEPTGDPIVVAGDTDRDHLESFECTQHELTDWMSATLDIRNLGDERADYRAVVVFETKDGSRQLGRGLIFASSLEPGQVITEETSTAEAPPASGFRCRVVEFDRDV